MNVLKFVGVVLLALSFTFAVTLKAEEKETSTPEIGGFQLFQSPIQPGGTWGGTINFKNAWDAVVTAVEKKVDVVTERYAYAQKQSKYLVEYAYVLAESDPALLKLKDDTERGTWTKEDKATYLAETWKEAVEKIRKERFEFYWLALRAEYAAWINGTGEPVLLPVPVNSATQDSK